MMLNPATIGNAYGMGVLNPVTIEGGGTNPCDHGSAGTSWGLKIDGEKHVA